MPILDPRTVRQQALEAFGEDYMADIPPSGAWVDALKRGKQEQVIPSLNNLVQILANDGNLPCPELNEFTNEVVTRLTDPVNGNLWTDSHDAGLRLLIERRYDMTVKRADLADAILVHVKTHGFHPVRQYLRSLKWDGKQRASRLWVDYLGAPEDDYHVEVAEKMLLGAVVRVMEPGHKFDFVTIIEGAQGRGKSTFIEILASGWFAGLDAGTFENRTRLVEKMQGAWILEVPELSAFSKSEVQSIKDIVSTSSDKVRLAYGRRAAVFPRQSIMIGSTNDDQYLRDQTGGRRFWPTLCRVSMIDTAKLRREVQQIWAETFACYLEAREVQPSGPLDLSLCSKAAQEVAFGIQAGRRPETAAEGLGGIVGEWLEGREDSCLIQIWTEAMRRDKESYNHQSALLCREAVKAAGGWDATGDTRRFPVYGKQRVIRPTVPHRTGTVAKLFRLES